jgi:hypothetical protein
MTTGIPEDIDTRTSSLELYVSDLFEGGGRRGHNNAYLANETPRRGL